MEGKKKERKGSSKTEEQGKGGTSRNTKLIAIIGIIVIIIIIAGALAYGLYVNQPSNFNAFRARFDSSQRVGIVAYANNGTEESYTVGCASAIIESVVESPTSHRNASTIDFFVLNSTSCVYENGVAGTIQNSTIKNDTAQDCLAKAGAEPSIFISYNSTNYTKVTPDSLQINGNAQFLSMCGIAEEIS